MQALNAAHINEDDYFAERIHYDLDKILWSIRDAHKNDSTSATTLSPVDDLKRSLEEVANFKGSETERLLMVFCAQTHLNYKKLTEEAKWLVHILKKSNLIKSGNNQRGKKRK